MEKVIRINIMKSIFIILYNAGMYVAACTEYSQWYSKFALVHSTYPVVHSTYAVVHSTYAVVHSTYAVKI